MSLFRISEADKFEQRGAKNFIAQFKNALLQKIIHENPEIVENLMVKKRDFENNDDADVANKKLPDKQVDKLLAETETMLDIIGLLHKINAENNKTNAALKAKLEFFEKQKKRKEHLKSLLKKKKRKIQKRAQFGDKKRYKGGVHRVPRYSNGEDFFMNPGYIRISNRYNKFRY